jgi:hypothetical protein
MKPRIGVYLSERMAARLAVAAKRPGVTKSALVEAALDHFLGSDDDVGDATTLARHLGGLTRQLEQLDRSVRIVNETVALHARFHLAVTPVLPAKAQKTACALGAERFEEFAAQVERRVHLGTSLMGETMDRLHSTPPACVAGELPEVGARSDVTAALELALFDSTAEDDVSGCTAAVREDGSSDGFPERAGSRFN